MLCCPLCVSGTADLVSLVDSSCSIMKCCSLLYVQYVVCQLGTTFCQPWCDVQDTADQYLRDRSLSPVLQAVIGGKFAQQIICRGVPYRSEKEEDFYQVQYSLDVRTSM